jgi:hypothetical protein
LGAACSRLEAPTEWLGRKNKLDLNSENIRQLFLKYGTVELHEKSFTPARMTDSTTVKGSPSLDLELPVDRDFISGPPFIDPQAMLRRIEENMPRRSTRPGEKERRLAEKISEEFVL